MAVSTSSRFKTPAIVLSIVFVLMLILAFIVSIDYPANNTANGSDADVSAAPAPSPTPSPTSDCAPEFVQEAGVNEDNQVDSDFETEYAATVTGAANLSEAQKAIVLKRSASNAQRLAIWAAQFGAHDDQTEWQSLVADGCLSQEGQAVYNKLAGIFSVSTFEEAQAPENGYNSGINNGNLVISPEPGIRGDLRAIKITTPDGKVVYIMVRCGNVVYDAPPPGVPPGTTDNPPPVTPPEVCPPDQVRNVNGVCVTPKSSNPDDYKKPGDDNTTDSGTGTKPRVPTVTTPPESSPPPVNTSVVGGGGVVDTPTNTPGTETGVTAPDAAPAPTTPTPVPSPEPTVNPGPDNSGENSEEVVNPYP